MWKLELPRLPKRKERQPKRADDDAPRRSHWFMVELRALLRRYSLLRDVLGALLIVGLVTGGIAGATGGVWPPVLAVESGSMMHSSFDTSYGRIGTIDVGDLIFVRAVDGPHDISLWVDGGPDRYGRPGDVIAYMQDGDQGPENLTILHRAITYVEVQRNASGLATYSFRWIDGQNMTFGPQGIYFPALGFHETFGFTRTNGYRPAYSGYITKGDNAFTNPAADQALGISKIVHPDWIVGEMYGEVPWLGLAKLATQSSRTNPQVPGWERVGNAFAPIELWSCFFVVLALVILVPFGVGTWKTWKEHDRRRSRLARAVPDYIARSPPPPPPPPPVGAQLPRKTGTFEVVASSTARRGR